MGVRFVDASGIDPFCIDQLATVSLGGGVRPNIELTTGLIATLEELGGTAGFTRACEPAGLGIFGPFDATLLSIDNRMIGPIPAA